MQEWKTKEYWPYHRGMLSLGTRHAFLGHSQEHKIGIMWDHDKLHRGYQMKGIFTLKESYYFLDIRLFIEIPYGQNNGQVIF